MKRDELPGIVKALAADPRNAISELALRNSIAFVNAIPGRAVDGPEPGPQDVVPYVLHLQGLDPCPGIAFGWNRHEPNTYRSACIYFVVTDLGADMTNVSSSYWTDREVPPIPWQRWGNPGRIYPDEKGADAVLAALFEAYYAGGPHR